jgi:tetratricopeptide (TPR) repeat protein
MKHIVTIFLLTLMAAVPLRTKSQYTFLDLPRASQMASVSQRIGTTDITVAYSRPAVNGRNIWGEVVPYDKPWRAGANENTTITFSSEVKFGGAQVAAGTYGLHMIPKEKAAWTVILSKDHNSWGSFYYKKENDAARIEVMPVEGGQKEHLAFMFDDLGPNKATLYMKWAGVSVPMPIEVDVHGNILATIDDQLKGLSSYSWEPWYEAAHYAHQEKFATEQAMKWIDRSITLQPNFENQSLKAEILASAGKTAEAEAIKTKMLETASNAELNRYGYMLLQSGKQAEAIKIFEMNAKRHPKDPNVHDSLGEGYMEAGQKDLAIKSFKRSLSMDPPENVKENSIRCLKKLGVDTAAWEQAKRS